MPEYICVGSKVEIAVNGKVCMWNIVYPGESDLRVGKISSEAPLVKLIIGAKAGDKIRGDIMGREMLVEINRIQSS